MALTPTTRYVVKMLDELLVDDPELHGNLTTIAGWLSLDRKNAREALEAIAVSGILDVTKEDQGKAGVFYTITVPQASPKHAPTVPQAYPDRTPSEPQAYPERTPDKSANNAASEGASLYRGEENRGEEKREEPPLPPTGEEGAPSSKKNTYPAEFEACWAEYPKREGGDSKAAAHKAWRARVAQKVLPSDLLAGTKRYLEYCQAKGWIGSGYVKQAATFYGPSEYWTLPWTVAEASKTGGSPTPSTAPRPPDAPPDPELLVLRDKVARRMIDQGRSPNIHAASVAVQRLSTDELRRELQVG